MGGPPPGCRRKGGWLGGDNLITKKGGMSGGVRLLLLPRGVHRPGGGGLMRGGFEIYNHQTKTHGGGGGPFLGKGPGAERTGDFE